MQPYALMHMLLHETGKTRDRKLFYIGKNILQSGKLTTVFKIKIYVVLCLICKIKSNQMTLFKNRRIAYIIFFLNTIDYLVSIHLPYNQKLNNQNWHTGRFYVPEGSLSLSHSNHLPMG